MTASSFYIRYLLLPTTLAASLSTLAWLSHALARPLGAHAWTASMAGAMVVLGISLGVSERLAPADRVTARRSARQHRGDVLHTLLTTVGLLASSRALTWLCAHRAAGLHGLSLATWPLALQVIFAFLTSEVATLLIHWASHRSGIRLLWRMHALHHRPDGLSLLSGSRSDLLDIVHPPLALVPAAVLGASPGALAWCQFYQIAVGAFQHCDLDIRMGLLNWVLPGPEVHRVHHHIDPSKAVSFSLNAPFLDLFFGTAGPLTRPGEVPMGVAGESD